MKKKTKVETVDLGKTNKVRKGALHAALGMPQGESIGQARIMQGSEVEVSGDSQGITFHRQVSATR